MSLIVARFTAITITALAALGPMAAPPAAAAEPDGWAPLKLRVVHFFGGYPRSPTNPASELILGSDGLMYGTTGDGGRGGNGTVFRLEADESISVLHAFAEDGSEGTGNINTLIEATDGALYGVASNAGPVPGHAGTVFRLGRHGRFEVLHAFAGSPDGEAPISGLMQASDGALGRRFDLRVGAGAALNRSGRFADGGRQFNGSKRFA